MTAKEEFIEWAAKQEGLPLFMQPWWMEAVCAGKDWNVLLSRDEHGQIVAVLPYLFRHKWWMSWIIMPQLTQIGGIWMVRNGGLIDDDQAFDIERVCRDFDQQLRQLNIHYYYQQYPINSRAVPAMRALGYKVRERVTYRIEDLHDMDGVIARFSKNKRRQLQKSLSLHAERGMSAEEFYRFHTNMTQLKKRKMSYSREFLLVCDRKTRRKEQGDIIAIKNADGQIYAAAYLIWDSRCMFYLISAIDPIHRNSGAAELLVLEALKLAREKGVIFDLNSKQNRTQDSHFKQFGATKASYYTVEKSFSFMSLLIRLFGM